MQLHDTHFHLDLFERPEHILKEIEEKRIYTIAVTNLPAVFSFTRNLVAKSKYVRAALGFHPELAAQHKQQFSLFLELLNSTRYIGEVGLDNFRKTPSDYLEQRRLFEKVLAACNDAGSKILTVHSRRAERDLISMIGPQFSGKIILHWYSGSLADLEKALTYGFYFSINQAMTRSTNGRKIIEQLPLNRILLETDSPFIKAESQTFNPFVMDDVLNEIINIKRGSGNQLTDYSFAQSNFKAVLT